MSAPEPLPDCYEGDPDLLPPGEAMRRIRTHVRPVQATGTVAVIDALGRVAARDVISPMDVPGHTNSAMDGYACAGDSLPDAQPRWYEVAGTAYAGKPFAGRPGRSQAVRIMTGAVMPEGTDTVVMREHVEVDGDRVRIPAGARAGQHVRHAGEDLTRGAVVVPRGRRLMPAEMGLLASLGVAEVEVFRTLRVACFSTGDEIRSPGAPFEPGLVYDSNRFTMHGLLGRLGVEIVDLGIVPDRRDAVLDAFREASSRADVVLSSGGASTGEADYVKEVLAEIGQVGFWRIAIRPGRPLAFGFLGDAVFFGLPGNPVAVMVTFCQFVAPAIRAASGETDSRPLPAVEARCTTRLRKKPGRVEYYRAVLERDGSGALVVRSTGKSGSGLLHTMSDANCFIVLPEDGATVGAGCDGRGAALLRPHVRRRPFRDRGSRGISRWPRHTPRLTLGRAFRAMNDTTATRSERELIALSICVLTVSDTRTEETDKSGKLLADRLTAAGHVLYEKRIVPDDIYRIRAAVSAWIADPEVNAVISTGGTGVTGRDGTPEAVGPLLDKTIDGFGEVFRTISYEEVRTSTIQSPRAGRGGQRDLRLLPPRLLRRVPHRVGQAHRRAARLPHPSVQPRGADAAVAGEIGSRAGLRHPCIP